MEPNMQFHGTSVRAGGVDLADRIRTTLQERIGPKRYNAWFRHGTQLTVDRDLVRVAVPNPFVANWIESHYGKEIEAAAEDQTQQNCCVVVTVDPDLSGTVRQRQLDQQAAMVNREQQGATRPRPLSTASPLRHKLDDFVVGDSNKLAYSAAMAVSSGGTSPFNPLFVHGPCGVGKTHLLHGICARLAEQTVAGRSLKCQYVTAEAFTNEFIASLRAKKLDEFRARYRRLDLLAIDDVHFLAAKRATQDEFLHTFNAISGGGNQIVLASDTHPRLVGDLNEQLVSRFMAGMVVKVEPPDRATRVQILQRWSTRLRLQLDSEVVDYVASHIRGSVRELEGTLIKLGALAALSNGRVDLALAREALADHLARTESVITLGDVEAVVAGFFGVTPADIHSSRRTRTVSLARSVVMYLARRYTHMSFPEIGRHIGKNHSSVVLGSQRIEQALADNEPLWWTSPAGRKELPARQLIDLLTEQIG